VSKKVFGLITAGIAWVAVGLQWQLSTGSLVNFLSYFTIQCNLLVAISLTFSLALPASQTGKYFSRVSVQTAIALYIFIVGLIYNLVLRKLNTFSGLQWAVDNILHVLVPVLYVFYWVSFVPKGNLKWIEVTRWAVFPLAYVTYSLVRGSMVHWYPYPFLNLEELGAQQVFLNVAVIILVFIAAGCLSIGISRSLKKE
jgi:hypothetical protein